jgi:hypothetical protein
MGRAEDIFEKIIKEGEAAIDEFILTRKSEELFLDFKRSADNGNEKILHQNDRDNLAKAISGFGNSEGGVIVWGVDCSPAQDLADVAKTKIPINNVKRFLSWLEGAVSGCTIPPHIGVQHHCITINNQVDGFVASVIPKSMHAPHQVVGKLQYFIRAGSNFVPTPHAVLAGMFGRRPQPNVFHQLSAGQVKLFKEKIEMQVGFLLRNQGPGIATDLFINVMVISNPGDNTDISFNPPDLNNWKGQFSFGRHVSMISKTDFRLPPEAWAQPVVMNLSFSPPFSRDLKIDCLCGCSQAPSTKFTLENDRTIIEKLYTDFMEKNEKGVLVNKDKIDIIEQLLNTKNTEQNNSRATNY